SAQRARRPRQRAREAGADRHRADPRDRERPAARERAGHLVRRRRHHRVGPHELRRHGNTRIRGAAERGRGLRRRARFRRRVGPREPHRREVVLGAILPRMTSADLVLFSILGGTALLLYGVRLVGEGLQRAAGTRLRHVLSTLTGNRFKALAVGAGVTAVLQSSSATTVMLVGFASAGLLSLRQTIGVILGADIGTTVTVQLLAFDLLALSPLVVFIGWLLWAIGRNTARYVGQ